MSVLKVDITIVGLIFSISNFSLNKTAQGRKTAIEKNYLLEITWLYHITRIEFQNNFNTFKLEFYGVLYETYIKLFNLA